MDFAGMRPRRTPPPPAPLSAAVAAVFGAVAAMRDGARGRRDARGVRALHPGGVSYLATLRLRGAVPPTGSPLLDEAAELDGVVRLSRGAGLPEAMPDVLGIAVRILDADGPGAHRDLLFASSAAAPILRHLLVPARRFGGRLCSTVLRYRTPTGPVLLAARAHGGATLGDLRDGATPPRIDLLVGGERGAWRPFGFVTPTTRLDAQADAALAFDPWNAGPDLLPAGLFNALRHPAYAASRTARGARLEDGDPTSGQRPRSKRGRHDG